MHAYYLCEESSYRKRRSPGWKNGDYPKDSPPKNWIKTAIPLSAIMTGSAEQLQKAGTYPRDRDRPRRRAGGSRRIVSSASRALQLIPPDSGHIAASDRSATKSADARRCCRRPVPDEFAVSVPQRLLSCTVINCGITELSNGSCAFRPDLLGTVGWPQSERFKEAARMLGVHERDVDFAASAGPYEKGHEGAQASNPHSRTNPRQPAAASTFWIY